LVSKQRSKKKRWNINIGGIIEEDQKPDQKPDDPKLAGNG